MSYNVTISRNTIPTQEAQAWEYLENLQAAENWIPSKDFIDLIEKLKLKFPCICEIEDPDEGVWSDGPLTNNAGENITILGMVYSAVEEVMPFLIKTANENGFVVFDDQDGKIYRPT